MERVCATQYMEEGRAADISGEHIPNLIPIDDDIIHVLDVLCSGGFGAWIVGGAVRDCVLGRKPTEYDICTDATPEQVIESFEKTIPTGKKYGTITVKSGNSQFEVTTLRTETGYGDGRRPDIVEWGTSLEIDLSRRDFTMNAMAYDCARELLHDPFGGKEDLASGNLRAVGDAHHRLSEDGLRIMRAYRFMDRQENGIWLPDKQLSAALIDNRAMLALISIERIWNELERIILGPNADFVLARMNRDGVLPAIIGYPLPFESFELVTKLPSDLEARIAILFSSLKSLEVNDILMRLRAPKKVIKRCRHLHFLIDNTPAEHELRLYRMVVSKEVNTHISLASATGKVTSLIEKSLQYPTDITCLVDGEWLMKKTKFEPGMKLGRLKDWLYRIQIERGYTSIAQMETALCTIPWNEGDSSQWPKVQWP
ncbi:MAG: CCA tRNA nucleotidyltransferase [Euryarchaeota archaeon]|nr:CCA tRNA nucleotidyltransferase [Euryarchaeota archaeon]